VIAPKTCKICIMCKICIREADKKLDFANISRYNFFHHKDFCHVDKNLASPLHVLAILQKLLKIS